MLEDNHEDIIAKAMRGKSIGKSPLLKVQMLKEVLLKES